MYIKKNIYKSHTKYSIEEKEKMVLMYLNGEMSANEIVDKYPEIPQKHGEEAYVLPMASLR